MSKLEDAINSGNKANELIIRYSSCLLNNDLEGSQDVTTEMMDYLAEQPVADILIQNYVHSLLHQDETSVKEIVSKMISYVAKL